MNEQFKESLVESLISRGDILDGDKARTRLRLGHPTWLVLKDLGLRRAAAVFSQTTGIPLLEHHIESHYGPQECTVTLQQWVSEKLTSQHWFTGFSLPTALTLLSRNRFRHRNVTVDLNAAFNYGLAELKARRWVPLDDGRVAIADPFGPVPNGELAGRNLCIASAEEIDRALSVAFPREAESERKQARRLGRLLLDAGAISGEALAEALDEQARSGGRLNEVLLAHAIVDVVDITRARAKKLGYPLVRAEERPVPLLPANQARLWRAVALSKDSEEATEAECPIPVAFSEVSARVVKAVEHHLGGPVQPKLTDSATLDQLLAEAYIDVDVEEVTTSLLKLRPHLSAYRIGLSPAQFGVSIVLLVALVAGFAINVWFPVLVMVATSSVFYILYMIFRTYASWVGWRGESTVNPSLRDLRALHELDLPVYSILLPVYKENVLTLSELFVNLSKLEYPRQKLDGMLLVEADDYQTQEVAKVLDGRPEWLRVVDVPHEVNQIPPACWILGQDTEQGNKNKLGWLRTLLIPPGGPRTKPKAMVYGLLYARGELLTVYDAEDQPDPYQLKKAAWAFSRLDDSVACLQAKLNYYNPRQNLLTRWFTMEYSTWFDTFLPGLHVMGAPIPLGGTSNHFRIDALKEILSWDPYNVTEDADLGVRFARMGKRTLALESTTYEEANSNLKNWIRQRSRWIKGYMQTFLVHTRHPKALYQELGLRGSLAFLAIVGGLIFTVLVSPIFWTILLLWILAQPDWIPALFAGPVYYIALISLLIGNFLFVFLAVIGAVGRGYDDLALYALLTPIYWLLMSVAGYVALYELIVRPHYWQKTEHGLHLQRRDSESSLAPNLESSP